MFLGDVKGGFVQTPAGGKCFFTWNQTAFTAHGRMDVGDTFLAWKHILSGSASSGYDVITSVIFTFFLGFILFI